MPHKKKVTFGVVLIMAAALAMTLVATPAFAAIATNACRNTAVPTDATQLDVTWTATAPASTTPGGTATLSNINMSLALPGSLFVAGYNLLAPVIHTGVNTVPGFVAASITATHSVEGTQSTNVASVSVSFTITDPDGIPGTGDETASDATVPASFSNMTWTNDGTGPAMDFREVTTAVNTGNINNNLSPDNPAAGSIRIDSVLGGFLHVKFACEPGTITVIGPQQANINPIDPSTTFATTAVTIPPTAPVCTDFSTSVGVTQSLPIDLNPHCSDVNGNIDPTTFTLSSPGAGQGSIAPTGNGTWTYTAPAVDPGTPVSLAFTVTDLTSLVSNTAHVSITILANQCDATSAPCSLNEIIVQPVVGTTLTMSKVPGLVVMSTIILNGQPQVSTGSLADIQVINARGTGNAWSVTGYVTDLGDGTPSMPSGVVPPGITIPMCSLAGSLHGALGPSAWNRHCIPGDNLGWNPTAAVAHLLIPGDVAQVNAGPGMFGSAQNWLDQLVANFPNLNGTAPNGLGGLQETNLLCTGPTDHSGGTFNCDASLALGVPASAAAGTFTGGLVLTLS